MDFTIQLNPRAFQPLHLQQCFRILFPVGNASKMVIQRNNLVQRKDDPLRIVSVRGLVLADHDGIVEVEDLKVILFVNDQVSWGDVLVHYAVLVVEVVYHGKELSESLNTEWTARGVIVMQRAAFDEYSGKPDSSSPIGSRSTESNGTMCGWSRGNRLQLFSSYHVRNMAFCINQYLNAAVVFVGAVLMDGDALYDTLSISGPRRSSSLKHTTVVVFTPKGSSRAENG